MEEGVGEFNGREGANARATEARSAGIDRIEQALDGHASLCQFEQSRHKSC
jgi:uncharacterized protein YfaA (DUF2138 family)